ARPPAREERVPHPHARRRRDRAGRAHAQGAEPPGAALSRQARQDADLLCPHVQPAGVKNPARGGTFPLPDRTKPQPHPARGKGLAMRNVLLLPIVTAALVCAALAPAHAQLVHSWVASNGNDSNACDRQTPCATFAGAYNKTAAGGEISCV